MIPRKKIYISIIVFIIISVLLIVFLLIPTLTNIKKNSEDLILRKEELAQTEKEIKTFKETESVYENSKEDVDKISKLFYDPENYLEFMDFITEKPKSYNLNNEILKSLPNPTTKSDFWSSYSFQISSIGSFPSLMKFIKSLEKGPYLIEIMNISIKKTSGEGSRGVISQNLSPEDVNASLLIKVYSK